MKIVDHKIQGIPFVRSPNVSKQEITPELIVIHYTASKTMASTVDWFGQRESRVSAHLIINTNGKMTQMVPFNQKAWHCGKSDYAGRKNLNNYAIGIELVNQGWVDKADGSRYWFPYPDDQLLVTEHMIRLLAQEYYTIEYLVGHNEISPGRKVDPGPLFPMDEMRMTFNAIKHRAHYDKSIA